MASGFSFGKIRDFRRFYMIWAGMKRRCYTKKNSTYPYYGGKGISVSKRWQEFPHFFEDMYEEYREHAKAHGEENTTLDRLNNYGNYTPSNCRWATRSVQRRNQSPRS